MVPEAVAKHFAEQMAKPDLVFKTVANSGPLEAAAREKILACQHDWEVKTIDAETPEYWACKLCGTPREDDAKTH